MPRRRRGFLKSSFNLKLKKHTLVSIAQILCFAIAGLIIVSFSRQGFILNSLNSALVLRFSWTALFIPFFLIVSGMMMSRLKTPLNQPAVLLGSVLFALCAAALTRAGSFGDQIWQAIAVLITGIGAAMVFFGGMVIGILVFFNTSLDRVIAFFISLLVGFRHRILGTTPASSFNLAKNIKVSGVASSPGAGKPTLPIPVKEVAIAAPAVNLPGQAGVWDYPPLSLVSDTHGGKADR